MASQKAPGYAEHTAPSRGYGFDVAAFDRRACAELSNRGVPLARDESIYLAELYAARARERQIYVAENENMFGHPLWVHVAAVHDERRQCHVVECQPCALLWALWLPYVADRNVRDRNRAVSAQVHGKAVPKIAALRVLLAGSPDATHDVALLAALEERARRRAVAAESTDPTLSPVVRSRGRPPLNMLRAVEATLKAANFSDSQITYLVFGDSKQNLKRSVSDRRRPKK